MKFSPHLAAEAVADHEAGVLAALAGLGPRGAPLVVVAAQAGLSGQARLHALLERPAFGGRLGKGKALRGEFVDVDPDGSAPLDALDHRAAGVQGGGVHCKGGR